MLFFIALHKTMTEEMLSNQLVTEVQVHGREDDDAPITAADQQEMRGINHVKPVVSRS